MPERPSVRAVGWMSLGLVLGIVGGWLAGMLQVRTKPEETAVSDRP